MFREYNPNPAGRNVSDCAIRAIAKALDVSWEEAFIIIMINAYNMCDMPSANSVWGSVLRQHGFYRVAIPQDYPDDYTAEDFCIDNPSGVFVLGFGKHTATVIDGDIYDSWNSSQEIPQYYWYKKEGE